MSAGAKGAEPQMTAPRDCACRGAWNAIARSEAELASGTDLWRAPERAPWPVDPQRRINDANWVDVADRAAASLNEAQNVP